MIFRKAVLIIHGFAGGVYDEESLATFLESKRGLDVYTFTLPGHEKGVKMKNKYNEWIDSAEQQINQIIKFGYRKIYIIGHSMGGVIATYLANKYPQIKKVVLAAPAFKYLYVEGNDIHIFTTIKNTPLILTGYSKQEVISRVLSVSPTAVQEFRQLVQTYQDEPKKLNKPVLIIHGTEDHIVPKTSTDYVYNNCQSRIKTYLSVDGANHDLFRDSKTTEINTIIYKFFKNKYKNTKIKI